MLHLQRDHYPNCRITFGDAAGNTSSPVNGAEAVYDGTTIRAKDRNGISLGEIEVAPDPADGNRKVQRMDGKTFRYTAADGSWWEIYRGCGCGG